MNITPIAGKVLLKLQRAPEKSDGGMIIPEYRRNPENIAQVVAVGKARAGQHIDIEVGNRVLFNPHCPADDVVEGELRLIAYEEIFALIEPSI